MDVSCLTQRPVTQTASGSSVKSLSPRANPASLVSQITHAALQAMPQAPACAPLPAPLTIDSDEKAQALFKDVSFNDDPILYLAKLARILNFSSNAFIKRAHSHLLENMFCLVQSIPGLKEGESFDYVQSGIRRHTDVPEDYPTIAFVYTQANIVL